MVAVSLHKFVAASLGVALTAQKGVWFRVAGQGAAVVATLGAMVPALNALGILGAPVVMCLATIVTMVIYWWASRFISKQQNKVSRSVEDPAP